MSLARSGASSKGSTMFAEPNCTQPGCRCEDCYYETVEASR